MPNSRESPNAWRSTASSVPAQTATWITDLTARLGELGEALEAHIADVESPEGIIAQVIRDAPRLAAAAGQLTDDHPKLRRLVAAVSDRLVSASSPPEPEQVRDIRGAILDLIGELSSHRQLGADFIYDAYSFDIGGQS